MGIIQNLINVIEELEDCHITFEIIERSHAFTGRVNDKEDALTFIKILIFEI